MMQQPHAHLARSSHKEPPPHAPNAALLIDFDNVTMGIRSDLQSELKRLLQSEIIRGKVAVQRAYADWRRYPQYIVPLSESSIDLIFAPAYGSNKKNATDIRLAIDALELVFTRPEIGTFILLSGDSDFSSLVLKLKEYGKYVIGVGIRESSSDLLIQNCDEYYSYNELAGLTKESDVTHERREPWELVVEAVKQMTAHNDVMRSDRLKQVMQEIDPSFNEKDIGFSRFSKFVLEAAHRGLITLTKLDNGQYEIALGPEVAGAAAQPGTRAPAREHEASGGRERHGEGRGRRGGRGEGGGREPAFSLTEAFGVLKQALARLGASEHSVTGDQVRDAMVEISGATPALEPDRFPRLLRQAQDADIIDLSKEEDGAYAVRMRVVAEPAPSDGEPTPFAEEALAGEPAEPTSSGAGAAGGVPSRSPRFRRGSRGPRIASPDLTKIGVVEVDPNFKPRIELVPAKPSGAEAAGPASPAPGRGDESRPERGERGPNRGRSDQGRRGSGRGHSSGRDRESSERGGGGRGRRGGRGRGGRGRRGGESSGGERGDAYDIPRVEPAVVDAVPPASPPPLPSPPRAEPPAAEPEGESFWTRVKRGLTGNP